MTPYMDVKAICKKFPHPVITIKKEPVEQDMGGGLMYSLINTNIYKILIYIASNIILQKLNYPQLIYIGDF